jgi:hypothetical protein
MPSAWCGRSVLKRATKVVEAGLLLEHVRRGGLRRFAFEREMHAFMTAVVLRMARSI